MLQDLHTEDGQRALKVGEEWEERLWEMFSTADKDARWISRLEGLYLSGHDFIFKGKRVEVKTNAGTDKYGVPYDTCCLELETRGGYVIGWRQAKADVLILVNRSQSRGYFYDAKKLITWSKHRPYFWKHDAKCTTIYWEQPDAGFMTSIDI